MLLACGLRIGEALQVRWGCVQFGEDADDRRRHLLIDQSNPRGEHPDDETKSGRTRVVGMSRRLQAALTSLYREQFEPSPDRIIVPLAVDRWRRVGWRRILKRARVAKVLPKDLRDTYASWLLTSGVQLGYISVQLGHANPLVTAQHYAASIGDYREPLVPTVGELPADLIERICEGSEVNTGTHSGTHVPASQDVSDVSVWNLVSAAGIEPATGGLRDRFKGWQPPVIAQDSVRAHGQQAKVATSSHSGDT